MRYTDQIWISDNTDPFDRLSIQDGFTHAFTPAVMVAWTTDVPHWSTDRTTDLRYRFPLGDAGRSRYRQIISTNGAMRILLSRPVWWLTTR